MLSTAQSQRQTSPSRSEMPVLAPSTLLYSALWFASLCSLIDLGIVAGRWLWTDQIMREGAHYIWMAPLGHLVLFLAGAIVLIAARACWRRLASPRIVGLSYTWLAVALPLWEAERLHKIAGLLLAVGITAAGGRLAAYYGRGIERVINRSTRCVIASLACIVFAGLCWNMSVEWRSVRGLPERAKGAPNVLLIVLDTLRADELGCYGYSRATSPALDRLAGESLQFMRAYSTSPWTLPSHASMFTGRLPADLSCDFVSRLDKRHSTLAEILASRGYHTSAFVANAHYCAAGTGLGRGFIHYEDAKPSIHTFLARTAWGRAMVSLRRRLRLNTVAEARKTAEHVNEDFLNWLELNRRSDRPFFAFLNFADVHDPYIAPAGWKGRFGPAAKNDLLSPGRSESSASKATYRAAYDSCLAYLDHQIGRLLESLMKRGDLDDTLLIVTADHGEQFGEHGLFLHGNSVYEPVVRVPLLVRLPESSPTARRVHDPVSLADLGSTILDIVGGASDRGLTGTSLVRTWMPRLRSGDDATLPLACEVSFLNHKPRWLISTSAGLRALVSSKHKYVVDAEGNEELYDLSIDPEESRNLVRAAGEQKALSKFRKWYAATWGPPPKRSLLAKASVEIVRREPSAQGSTPP